MKQCLERFLFRCLFFGKFFRNGSLVLVGVLLSLSVTHAASKDFTIEIIISGNSKIYYGVVDTLEKKLNAFCNKSPATGCSELRINQTELTESLQLSEITKDNPDLIITVGRKAANSIDASLIPVPILHTLIPKASYEKLWLSPHTNRNSALYLEQPLQRQINLAQIITPKTSSIGFLLGPSNRELASSLIQYLPENSGQSIQIEVVENKDDVGLKVRRLLKKSAVILALPDPTVYNRKTVPSILLSSYHNKVPVIGYSSSYVKAGALVAVFSTPEDIGVDTATIVQQFILSRKSKLPAPSFPKSFHIQKNETVARSLGLTIPNEKTLEQRLRELEHQ